MKKIYLLAVSLFLLLTGTGCAGEMAASADDIVTNVLESDKEINAYYGEGEMIFYSGEDTSERSYFQEYAAEDGKRKTILMDMDTKEKTISINDGKQILIYEEAGGTAHTINIENMELPGMMTPREQVTNMLESMKDTHTYQVIGEEEINGMQTYHLKMKADSESSLLGDIEFWVDQKTWFMVKTKSAAGEFMSEVVYTDIDFTPDFDDGTFVLTLPEEIEVTSLDDVTSSGTSRTVDEAEKALGKSFYLFSDEKAEIANIEIYSMSGIVDREEISIDYLMDGLPAFNLTVFPSPEGAEKDYKDSELQVRGNQAGYEELIRGLIWDEEELRYSLIIENPELEKEVILEMAEKMILSSEEQ